MPSTNPEPEEIKALLQRVKTIAVIGFSPKPGRPSHRIARRMQEGAEDEESAERACAAGMTVVMGRCIMRDYARLCLG